MSTHEQWLRNAVSELMEIDAAQVAPTRPFAELGIDSLLGLRLARRLTDHLGGEFELEWIYDHPSIRELGAFLDERFGAIATASDATDQTSRASA